jgi:hypothetical protein
MYRPMLMVWGYTPLSPQLAAVAVTVQVKIAVSLML